MKFTLHKLYKQQNRRYNYTPRFYKGKDNDNAFSFDSSTFHKYRDQSNAIDFGAQWKEDRKASRNRKNRDFNLRVLIIAALLIFLFLWIIDFDLSIFKTPLPVN